MSEHKHLSCDIETELIAGGRLAPLIACVSFSYKSKISLNPHHQPVTKVCDPDEGVTFLKEWFSDPERGLLFGHNIAFDLFALCRHAPELAALVWRSYEEGRIWDLGIHERLYTLGMGWGQHPAIGRPIVTGGVKLAELARGLIGVEYGDLKGADSPRMKYGELIGVPLSEWPRSAYEYAGLDAEVTYRVGLHQITRSFNCSWAIQHSELSIYELPSQTLQNKAAWAFHHLSAWGLRSSPERVEAFNQRIDVSRLALQNKLISAGLLDEDAKKKMSMIRSCVDLAYGNNAPKTEKGKTQTSGEVLKESGDPILQDLAEYLEYESLRSKFSSTINKAAQGVLSPRWNTLVRSGRSSCTNPNFQQLPRKGGIREAFAPREGFLYVGADYSTAELVALAQVCLSWGFDSEMARALRRGEDLHLALAAELVGISYDEALDRYKNEDQEITEMRGLAKIPNFGLPGGLGVSGLKNFAKGYNKELSIEECSRLRDSWFKRWPEMSSYFRRISQAEEQGFITQLITKRRRGSVGFTDAANTMFQGLIADGAKHALYEVVKCSWMRKGSPLFGSRPILFIHDEIILETPIDKASAAGDELARVMVESMAPYLPDLPILAEPWISSVWSKSNRERRDNEGRLIDCSI